MTTGAIYLIGVIILGLAYYPLKESLTGPVFLGVAVTYLLALRFLAKRFGVNGPVGNPDANISE